MLRISKFDLQKTDNKIKLNKLRKINNELFINIV